MSKYYYLDYTGFSGLSKGAKIGLGVAGLSGLTALGMHALKEREKYKKFKESKGNENKSYLDFRKNRRFMKGVNKMRGELKDTGEIKITDNLIYKPHSSSKTMDLINDSVNKTNSRYAYLQKANDKYSVMYPLDKDENLNGKGIMIRNTPFIKENYGDKDAIVMK